MTETATPNPSTEAPIVAAPTVDAPTPAPEAAAPAPAPVSPAQLATEKRRLDVKDALAYDPFAKDNQPPQQPAPAKPVEGSAATPPAQPTPVAAPPAAPAQVQPADVLKAQLAERDGQIALLARRLQAIEASQVQQPGPAGQPRAPAQDDGVLTQYAFTLPRELTAALRSEDEGAFAQGMQVLLQHHAAAIHRNVVSQIQQHMQTYVPQVIASHHSDTSQRQQVETDFYGKYPQFNQPLLRPMVQQAAIVVAKELGVSSWSPALRDAIATRLVGQLQQLQPQNPAPPAAPPGPSGYRPPAAPARVNGAPPSPNSPDAIGDVLFGPR